jgi:radical SAM superfamily enzyme
MDSYGNMPGTVPMMDKKGAAFTFEERNKIAKRTGFCRYCYSVKTHKIKYFGNVRSPLTNENVHEGTCIHCQPDSVPDRVRSAFNRKTIRVRVKPLVLSSTKKKATKDPVRTNQ